jgi:hypothetical protein
LFLYILCWNRVESEESEDLHNKYKGMTADSDEKKLKQIIFEVQREFKRGSREVVFVLPIFRGAGSEDSQLNVVDLLTYTQSQSRPLIPPLELSSGDTHTHCHMLIILGTHCSQLP